MNSIEQEPDFSQKICEGLVIDDLDIQAIEIMRNTYSKKQDNKKFLTLSREQLLVDLDLVIENKITNAALILLGKKCVIKDRIPQSSIKLEYRKNETQIPFDKKYDFVGPFYLISDMIWKTVDLMNRYLPIQNGPHIFDVPYFNQAVIREAIYNAVAHRNYSLTSEIIIKQSDSSLRIISPGGFPLGVNLENLISVSSTPRNRLLSDVLLKTGLIERSGQGIDKIYYETLLEGKKPPDYSESDDFQVDLNISAVIEDKAFTLFLESVQSNLSDDMKLSVSEIIHLNNILNKVTDFKSNKNVIRKLLKRNLIEKRGRTRGTYYILSKEYYNFCDNIRKYNKIDGDRNQKFLTIIQYFKEFNTAKMKNFVDLFEGRLSRKQVRVVVNNLVDSGELIKNGRGKGTYYKIREI